MSIHIRKASREDVSALYDIYAQIGVKDEDYFERCLAEQDKGNRDVFIISENVSHYSPPPSDNKSSSFLPPAGGGLRRGGDDIGFCILNYQPRYAFYKRLNIPEIQDLNIVPNARRQGHAQSLIKHCEALVREKGHEMIGVSVGLSANYGPAQRLYAKLGYHPDGNGVTYDREPVAHAAQHPVDDDLCLMLVKVLG